MTITDTLAMPTSREVIAPTPEITRIVPSTIFMSRARVPSRDSNACRTES